MKYGNSLATTMPPKSERKPAKASKEIDSIRIEPLDLGGADGSPKTGYMVTCQYKPVKDNGMYPEPERNFFVDPKGAAEHVENLLGADEDKEE